MNHSQSLAIDEFSFRYLYPHKGKDNKTRALNNLEMLSQFSSVTFAQSEDISGVVLAALMNQPCPSELAYLQLVYAISKANLPNYVTPDSPYGRHCDYPSPRSYYPLKFLICRIVDGVEKVFHLNLERWTLDDVSHSQTINIVEFTDNTVLIQTDFTIYNELYNRFRYSLFALEVGHFQRAVTRHLLSMGQYLQLNYIDSRFIGHLAHTQHQVNKIDNLSKRTAGFFHYGLLPKPVSEDTLDLQAIAAHFHSSLSDYLNNNPDINDSGIELKVVLDNTKSIVPGLYSIHKNGLKLAKPGNFMPVVQEAYNYQNFSFIYSSCVFFFTVKQTAFSNNTTTVNTNNALGYLSQCLIEWFTTKTLFARPFRSYDQQTIDTFLADVFCDCTAYYGLLVGKNRAAQTLGAIK